MMNRLQTYSGLQLCSSRDPLKEARAWCDQLISNEAFLGRDESAIHYWVIGLGAGYHVEELALRKPQTVITVLEPRSEIRAEFESWGGRLRGQVLIESAASIGELFSTQSFQIFGASFSSVYRFLPCLQGQESWAKLMEETLLGKSGEGLSKISEILELPVAQKARQLGQRSNLTIKDFETLFDSIGHSSEKQLVSVLRELVR